MLGIPLLLVLLAGCSGTQSSTQSDISVLRTMSPTNFASATGSLDLFLAAWLQRDVSLASKQLPPGDHMLATQRERSAFLGNGGQPTGYELIGSKAVSSTEYEFEVWLYVYAMGLYGPKAMVTRASPALVLVRKIGERWYVASMPKQMSP